MPFLRRAALALLTCVAVVLGGVGHAHAEDGFRYWGYYSWTGQDWVFASVGAHQNVPENESVEGWRYAVSGNTPRVPRTIGDFDVICAGVPAEDGKKRVAVVIDYGTTEDAPAGEAPEPTGTCVLAEPDATGLDILGAVTDVRQDAGQVCGVQGFPETGCGDPVNDISVPTDEEPVELTITDPVGSTQWNPTTDPSDRPTASPAPTPTDSGNEWQTWALGGGMLLVIVASGFVLTRRRQRGH